MAPIHHWSPYLGDYGGEHDEDDEYGDDGDDDDHDYKFDSHRDLLTGIHEILGRYVNFDDNEDGQDGDDEGHDGDGDEDLLTGCQGIQGILGHYVNW